MILQALTEYYETLAGLGKAPVPGWSKSKVSYALCIDEKGKLTQTVCLKTEQQRGKKEVLAPRQMELPVPTGRSSGVAPSFLCDNSSYFLGIDNKGKPRRSKECFEAAKKYHLQLLENADSPAAGAVCAFFREWDPEKAQEHPALKDNLEDILPGGNLIFRFESAFVHKDPEIRELWNTYYENDKENVVKGTCLVTGREDIIEPTHPFIKGVQGAQSSGAALVSFNVAADCSYGKTQDFNAPVGKYAAFAYTTALNYLLADWERVVRMGDSTVVCWAKNGDTAYQNLMDSFAFDAQSSYTSDELIRTAISLCNGDKVQFDESRLDPEMEFYILGLSPNAARLSVRFFLKNSFGAFLRNVMAHHRRLEIAKPAFDRFETIPLWKLLGGTVNQKSKDKVPVPNLAGEVLRSILSDTPYPSQLLNGVNLRLRAEREISRGRAAIIKAYYLKKPNKDVPKEVLTVSLNPESKSIPYTLGRLFSVLEAVQVSANPDINATIKNRYFNAASATPAHIFPTLINLAQKHLKKLSGGLAVYYDKQLTNLMSVLGENYPNHLNIPQQGAFQLGYYHQTQARYEGKNKKEENENV